MRDGKLEGTVVVQTIYNENNIEIKTGKKGFDKYASKGTSTHDSMVIRRCSE